MFFHFDLVADDLVAMQEIEVIGMDHGVDNIKTTSFSLPLMAWSPPMVELSDSSASTSSSSSSSSSKGFSAVLAPRLQSHCHENEALEILLAMLSNESTLHTTDHRTRLEAACRGISSSHSSSSLEDNANQVNDHDRAKMCDWYYEMSDFLKIDRATASRSLALLDRFMATPVDDLPLASTSTTASTSTAPSFASDENITVAEVVLAASKHRDVYHLVALTALFLAIKLFERLSIEPSHVSYLSRGRYTAKEVVKMESIMLHALEWKVCSADKVDFVNAYLDVVLPKDGKKTPTCAERRSYGQSSNDSNHHQCVLLSSFKDLANIQIQLSDYDSSFSPLRPSLVAIAAVNNALEIKKNDISTEDQHIIHERIHVMNEMLYYHGGNIGNSIDRSELARTMERLQALVDPTVVGRSVDRSSFCGTPSDNEQTSTIAFNERRRFSPPLHNDNFSSSSVNTQQQYAAVSPLDVALESIENFDMTQLFCCGSTHHDNTDHSFHNSRGSTRGSNRVVLGTKKKERHASHHTVKITDSPSPKSVIFTTRIGARLL